MGEKKELMLPIEMKRNQRKGKVEGTEEVIDLSLQIFSKYQKLLYNQINISLI